VSLLHDKNCQCSRCEDKRNAARANAGIGMYADRDALSHAAGPSKAAPFVPLAKANSAQRKMLPVASGVLDYFPDALSAVAYVSYLGNQKHNPGEPLHWVRGKSGDHIDCAARHMLRRTELDADGIMEAAEMVWRSLAWLQLEIERAHKLPPSPGSTT